MRRLIPFSEVQENDDIGAKAKNLGLLFQSHFPVPQGFVVAADALALAVQDAQCPDCRDFPPSLRQEIEEAYIHYIIPPAVVRSSCTAEDLSSASFAGQYRTILNVTSANLLESIRQCRLSTHKDHARSYLEHRFSADVRAPAMSVIVQEFVDADVSGVVFGQNPITGSQDEVLINSSFGLGDAVVSGYVTPDFFILAKHAPLTYTKKLGDKTCKTVPYPGGTHLVETTAYEKSSFSLRDEQLVELKNITLAVEERFGHPVDLEFAYRKGNLYLLQVRPITL